MQWSWLRSERSHFQIYACAHICIGWGWLLNCVVCSKVQVNITTYKPIVWYSTWTYLFFFIFSMFILVFFLLLFVFAKKTIQKIMHKHNHLLHLTNKNCNLKWMLLKIDFNHHQIWAKYFTKTKTWTVRKFLFRDLLFIDKFNKDARC